VKPYYDDGAVTIYHGDCGEILPELHADLIVTSPSYNLGRQSGAYANMRDGYLSHADDLPEVEYVAWQREAITAMWAAVAPNGAIFYNHKQVIRDGEALLPTRLIPAVAVLRQIIVWDRRVGMNWSPSHFCPQHEWLMLLAHRGFRLASRGHSAPGDVWDLAIEQTVEGHPCPFPRSIPTAAIGATDARVILDPFMGSGTTLRAAKDLGRRAIGIEIEERYCEIAAKRCAQDVLDLGEAA
jgi:site-specific DNA-methyltransferase (adenine-specific)